MRSLMPRVPAKAVSIFVAILTSLVMAGSTFGQAQATAADLTGNVLDPNGAAVAGATVTARNTSSNLARTVSADAEGYFQILALTPGTYEVTAEAATFKKIVVSGVKLTVGQSAHVDLKLEVGATGAVVNVNADDIPIVEPTRTTVANTIDQEKIQNLPINERSATGFALTISTVGRDNGRPIGPAPTSGLNIGGQRGRSTLIQVDGADFTDNSVNAARSTVSQEAVQEYQVTTNSYMAEFGRATGGIVNVVTKRGGNDVNGNLFGFFRHKSIQSRNAFAPVIDNTPGKKPPYTRAQYGATIGGPIKKNETYYFLSFEQRRRQESGFFTGDIVGGGTASVTIPVIQVAPGAFLNPTARTFTGLTPAQANYINTMLSLGTSQSICTARAYAFFVGIGAATALNGGSSQFSPNDGSLCPAISPVTGTIGNRFLLSGAPVPLTRDANGQLLAFRPLAQLQRVFPISEGTTYTSMRIDHAINANNQLSLRASYNPSRISGIQDESQNQTLGQNDYSRTGIQVLRDLSFGASWTRVMSGSLLNEMYYSFGRRAAKFDSQVPSVAHQISGTGFIGSNPFSPVDRVEERNQIRDNISWATGRHNLKFGGDANWIGVNAKFDLNFPGLFNFSQQAASSFIPGCDSALLPIAQRCPAFTPIQTYGLGFPSVFLQGFGNPNSTLTNKPVAFFGQDTWRMTDRFTLNFGIRYDYEFTQQFAPTPFTDPLTGITLTAAQVQAAQDALNVTQGFPRDGNNWAPRLGFAWDVKGNGRLIVRGAGGIFYDHPLLAVAFNSDIADGSQQQQATLLPIGGPSPTGLFNAFQVFHGTVCGVQGSSAAICGSAVTPGVASSAQYLFGLQRFNPATFTGFGPILPFTLNVSKDFQYPMAFQGNFSIEKAIGKNMSLTASYINVTAKHLGHPQDVNVVRSDRLTGNFQRFFGFAPTSLGAAAFGISIPTVGTNFAGGCAASPYGCFTNAAGRQFLILIPGMIAAYAPGGVPDLTNKVVNPITADYFRTLGPNYFFIQSASGGAVNKAIYDSQLAGSLATAGPINPYADVNAQLSDGNSWYNALNVEFKKRFSNNMTFLASYTWSHSIDDSSDLQTLLKPQDNRNFRAEKSNSLFDQRHRFVFSGVWMAPDAWKSGSGFHRFMHGFSVAPIFEWSSGRPFNILAVGDANGDFQSSNERPTLRSDGTLCLTGVEPNCQTGIFPANGTLGRNMGITHNYMSLDARVTRRVNLGERLRLDIIAEGFNLFNRFNEAAANPFYNVVNSFGQRSSSGRYYSQPTAAYDPRQFQFGLKLTF